VISPVGPTPKRIGTPASVAVSSISVPRSAASTTVRNSTAYGRAAAVAAVIASGVPPAIDHVPVPSRLTTASAGTAEVAG
jgi:hypothetical protein